MSEIGLEVILSVKSELDIDLDEDFIRKCFEIQKKHQFSHERAIPIQDIERLIDEYVDQKINKNI